MNEQLHLAVNLALGMLGQQQQPTSELVAKIASVAVRSLRELTPGLILDEALVAREIEARCNVHQPEATTLDGKGDHVEWYSAARNTVSWLFWNRYARYLTQVKRMPPRVVERLDEATSDILRLMENPQREGHWSCRGMVVGQVQSGKTANYTGLICKAADAGYKMIVILAGMHNSLRSQTQLRLDEGFLGFDTQRRSIKPPEDLDSSVSMGVGRLAGEPRLPVIALTNSAQGGDFRRSVADSAGIAGSKDPIVLVIKKNTSILKNLQNWIWEMHAQSDSSTGRKLVRDMPLLLIDDEADTASVNTNQIYDESGQIDEDLNPTKINEAVRKLLFTFSKSAYIGYTATPFANIYMHDGQPRKDIGEDLFPRSFIVTLRPPSNYFGAVRVFGHAGAPEAGIESVRGLDVARAIDDYQTWMPDRHRKDHSPESLPPSLRRAIRVFLVASAVRRARGHGSEHHSMLVHVTRFTRIQDIVTTQVQAELGSLQKRLKYGDGASGDKIRVELQALWRVEFEPTTTAFIETKAPFVSWQAVDAELVAAADKIIVNQVNGTARDALEYYEARHTGLSVIAIGGDKLSRGLTLEGLMVSYYLRASKMYDTLMQMGRWFGYRPEYEDVCRLYTTDELLSWYQEITLANEELLLDLEHMATMQRTPRDYGLKVRNNPFGLLVTAATKMRSGVEVKLSYSGRVSETIMFEQQQDAIDSNYAATVAFISDLHEGERVKDAPQSSIRWTGVSTAEVQAFLRTYRTHPDAHKARALLLDRYISSCEANNELTSWTVILVSNSSVKSTASIAGNTVGLIERDGKTAGRYTIKRLVNPSDELLDLSPAEKQEVQRRVAIGKQNDEDGATEARAARAVRPPSRGLLLLYPLLRSEVAGSPIIGFAVSFPESANATEIGYTVNNVYWKQEYGGDDN